MNMTFMEWTSTAQAVEAKQPKSREAERQNGPALQRLSIRLNTENANHHLWSNNGTWWVAATIHCNDYTKHRLRHSLRTKDISLARQRRDLFLGRYTPKDNTKPAETRKRVVALFTTTRFLVPVRRADRAYSPTATATPPARATNPSEAL